MAPGPDRFALRLGPDGVYRVDGRVVPIREDGAESRIDDREPVVGVHRGIDDRKDSGWAKLGTAS